MIEDWMIKRERNQINKWKGLKNKKIKGVQKWKFIDAPCESNLKTVIEEHVSSKNIHSDSCCQWWSIPSTSSQQVVKQIKVIQEIASPEVSQLNQARMNKKQGYRIQLSSVKKL